MDYYPSQSAKLAFLKAVRIGLANWPETQQILERLEVPARQQDAFLEEIVQDLQNCYDEQTGEGSKHYKSFMEEYFKFYRRLNNGAQPHIINTKDGPALKAIIKYLKAESKTNDYDGAMASWQYILANWPQLEDFYKKKTSLTSIRANLNEIITIYRNGYTSKKQQISNERSAREQLDKHLEDLL